MYPAQLHLLFFFRAFAEVCAGSVVGQYRKKLPLKINYSCIGIKHSDAQALVKLRYVFHSVNITFFDNKIDLLSFTEYMQTIQNMKYSKHRSEDSDDCFELFGPDYIFVLYNYGRPMSK